MSQIGDILSSVTCVYKCHLKKLLASQNAPAIIAFNYQLECVDSLMMALGKAKRSIAPELVLLKSVLFQVSAVLNKHCFK